MSGLSRRQALAAAATGAAGVARAAAPAPRWGRGVEGQRRADLGDGRYRNPIVPATTPTPRC